MKSIIVATAIAVAAIMGITSCAAPAPTAAAPASAAAAQLSPAENPNRPADQATSPDADEAVAEDSGVDYKSTYRKLLGGNVPKEDRVILVNPAQNRNNTFDADGWCFIVYGGTVKSTPSQDVYEYSYPFTTANTTCPDGTTFRYPGGIYDLESMWQQTKHIDQKFEEQLELAGHTPLFSDLSSDGEPPSLGLVRLINLAPISSTDKTFVFWSECTVKDHDTRKFTGQIELETTAMGITYARFTTTSPRKGGECPSGSIFFPEDQPIFDGLPLLAYDDGIQLG